MTHCPSTTIASCLLAIPRTVSAVSLHLYPISPRSEVQAAFDILEVRAVIRPKGADAENWTALTNTKELVVLRCDNQPGRPLAAVASWCSQLATAGLPVATPRTTTSGQWVYTDQDGDWTCWGYVFGSAPTSCPDTAQLAGQLLARIHAIDIDDGSSPAPSLVSWIDALCEYDPAACALLRGLTGPKSLCHLDLHASNLVAAPSGLVAIDFIDAGFADPALDIAVCSAFWGVQAGRSGLERFLSGYYGLIQDRISLELISAAASLLALRCKGTALSDSFTTLKSELDSHDSHPPGNSL